MHNVSDKTEDDYQQPSIDGDGSSRNEEVIQDGLALSTNTKEMQGIYEGGRSTDGEGYRDDGCRDNLRQAWSREPPLARVNFSPTLTVSV